MILLWLLAAILLLLLAVVATPVRVEFRATADEVVRFAVAVRPFGRFGPRISMPASRTSVQVSEKPVKATHTKQREPAKNRRKSRRDYWSVFRAAIELFQSVLSKFHVARADVDVRFGVDDPADTGQAYGMLVPIIYGFPGHRRIDVNVEPVFDGALLHGKAALDITFTPLLLIKPAIRFGWAFHKAGR